MLTLCQNDVLAKKRILSQNNKRSQGSRENEKIYGEMLNLGKVMYVLGLVYLNSMQSNLQHILETILSDIHKMSNYAHALS